MSRFNRYGCQDLNPIVIGYIETDTKVTPDLALSPAAMMRLAEQGIPVNTTNANQFFDGIVNPSFDLPLDAQRSVDVADLWEADRRIRTKASQGLMKDKKLFD